ncbi:MAG TPA: hypothetical protein VG389_23640 [Myxococcota bacterium]|jgi:hypothetical protein|nr:hypothetical protein [Myxococcota bacterium]
MKIEFHCTACEATYEVRIAAILRDATKVNCPECDEHPDESTLETFREHLEGLCETMSELNDNMRFTLEIDSEHLPGPFGHDEDGGEIEANEDE